MKREELEVLKKRLEIYDLVLDTLWEIKDKVKDDDVKWKAIRAIIRSVDTQRKMIDWAINRRERIK